jgi:hypothetical protein
MAPMTDPELALLSTIASVIGTAILFGLLAGWSTGASWDLTNAIVSGMRGWATDEPPAGANPSPRAEPSTLGRVVSSGPPPAAPASAAAVIEELGERPLL